jgi:transcriptional repressor NrdR
MVTMKCPYCGFAESKVIDSRPTDESNSIRRRRECLKCGKRFTTYEKLESISLIVIKKDQSRQPYDRNKVLKGIITACEKRPISLAQMEKVADDIESELYQSMEREVDSTTIGEKAMEKLKNLDEVAYVRFASVYKRFDDIHTFMEELQGLINDK